MNSSGNVMKKLLEPSLYYRMAFYKMAYDYGNTEDQRYHCEIMADDFEYAGYVETLRGFKEGLDLPRGLVPYTTYWLMDDLSTIYGVSRLRHILNDNAKKEGGHIGYDVPPSLRNQGNATLLLRLTLQKAAEMGIVRVLMTCDCDNLASVRVIEKCGGVLENIIVSDFTKKLVNRYWITL